MKTKQLVVLIILCVSITGVYAQKRKIKKDLKMYGQVWDDIVNKGEIDLINDTHFDASITILMQPENIVGIEAFKAYYQNYLTGFSDITFTVKNLLGQDNNIVKHWRFEGKHTGEFFGIPATGKSVDVEGITLAKMKNGKIAQEQDFLDNMVFLGQLGLLSDPNNMTVVDNLYKAFAKGDMPTVLGLMDEKVIWNEAESNSLAVGNPYIGPEAVLNGVFAKIGEMYKSFALKDIKLHEMSNNQVLATLYYVITAKNGETYNVQATHHYTLNDEGKISAFQQYVDTKKLAETEKE
jgi:steroid delta-isomerase-like uncharacterized protein